MNPVTVDIEAIIRLIDTAKRSLERADSGTAEKCLERAHHLVSTFNRGR